MYMYWFILSTVQFSDNQTVLINPLYVTLYMHNNILLNNSVYWSITVVTVCIGLSPFPEALCEGELDSQLLKNLGLE